MAGHLRTARFGKLDVKDVGLDDLRPCQLRENPTFQKALHECGIGRIPKKRFWWVRRRDFREHSCLFVVGLVVVVLAVAVVEVELFLLSHNTIWWLVLVLILAL